MRDAMLAGILSDCEAAGRRGEQDFYRVWHRVVCSVQVRLGYIRPNVFDQARAAWERGRQQVRGKAPCPTR